MFTDRDLADKVDGTWNGPVYSTENPMSCNTILNHPRDYREPHTVDYPWESGFIDVVSIHNVYICSPNFGNNALGPRGEKNILKKIVTTAGFGELIVNEFTNQFDLNDCGRKVFQQMEFQITDSFGNPLVLHGGHLSFTLFFVQ